MKTFLKWTGIFFAGLLLLVAVSAAYAWQSSQGRLERVYSIPAEAVTIPTDEESIAQGRHIFLFRGCLACHSALGDVYLAQTDEEAHTGLATKQLSMMDGNVYLEDPALGQVNASNLTSGQGGVAYQYDDSLWARAIRHGIRPDGTPLLFMPSTEFYYLSDEDLGAVIAFIKSAPPADHVQAASTLSFTGRMVMTYVKGITFIPAELVPHDAPRPAAPAREVSAAYGEYLTYSCKVCHGLGMAGGPIPGFPSSWPPALNLTFGEGSALPRWSEAQFMAVLRSGKTPDGRTLRGEYMPWKSYRYMDDLELQAVWAYLGSLPPKEYGSR